MVPTSAIQILGSACELADQLAGNTEAQKEATQILHVPVDARLSLAQHVQHDREVHVHETTLTGRDRRVNETVVLACQAAFRRRRATSMAITFVPLVAILATFASACFTSSPLAVE